jgi:hypothetical protein
VMALSADLSPLAMSYLVFYRCTDQRPTERSLPRYGRERYNKIQIKMSDFRATTVLSDVLKTL